MSNYLEAMDMLKLSFIDSHNIEGARSYPFGQYHYYEQIIFSAENSIRFEQQLFAVKLVYTTILFIDSQTGIKLYLSDRDIANMIKGIEHEALRNHIVSFLQKVIDGKKLSTLVFSIQEKTFKIKGIPFDARFNDYYCENPADIRLNGNDFIALINLILEKERTDTNPGKLADTAKYYIGLKNS